ncbi:MAG: HAMP domain-containing histidine kinase [Peptostreptococcaceae bacterium]|nr:HAMP domain-containing histidine kinase [Peptostreptococcaceae bacterium]
MDTKLKNYNKKPYIVKITASIIMFILVVTIFAVSIVGIFTLYDAMNMDGAKITKVICENTSGQEVEMTLYSVISIIFKQLSAVAVFTGTISIVSLVVSLAIVGKKEEDGKIKLNWFDKIFGEVQIVIMFAVGIAAVIYTGKTVYNYLYSIPNIFIGLEKSLDYYLWGSEYSYSSFFGLLSAVVVMLIASLLCLMLLLSLIKKGKAGEFTHYTLLGRLFRDIERSLKYKATAYWKILAMLLLGAILSYVSLESLIAVVLLVIIFLPKVMDKYYTVKEGVNQLKNGNFEYKNEVKGKGELDRLASDLNDISESLSIAMENEKKNQRTKTDLISNVSHDIKTPLTSMITYLDLLKFEGLDSKNAPEYLRVIDEKTQRLKKLTEDLFDAAKASSGDFPVDLVEMDLSAIVNQSLGEMDNYFEPKELDVVFNTHVEDIKVCADGRLLYRILENLFVNASKYSIEGSRIYVDIYEESSETLKLEIKNISKAQLNVSEEELMERFMRGDQSRTSDGSGLGLSIARDLAVLIGGKFDIKIDGDYFKANLHLKKYCE